MHSCVCVCARGVAQTFCLHACVLGKNMCCKEVLFSVVAAGAQLMHWRDAEGRGQGDLGPYTQSMKERQGPGSTNQAGGGGGRNRRASFDALHRADVLPTRTHTAAGSRSGRTQPATSKGARPAQHAQHGCARRFAASRHRAQIAPHTHRAAPVQSFICMTWTPFFCRLPAERAASSNGVCCRSQWVQALRPRCGHTRARHLRAVWSMLLRS